MLEQLTNIFNNITNIFNFSGDDNKFKKPDGYKNINTSQSIKKTT